MKKYIVQKDDTLTLLSIKFFKDTKHIQAIAQANPKIYGRNNGRLTGIDLIFTGEMLFIPIIEKKALNLEEGIIKIFINDLELTNCSNINMHTAYDTISNALSFQIPNNAENRTIFKPFQFQDVEFYHGKDKLLHGSIFNINVVDVKTLEIHCYSYSQHMATCNLPFELYPRKIENKSIEGICQKILPSLNIDFSATDTAKNNYKKIFKLGTTIAYNQTIADFIIKLSQERNIIIRPNNINGGIIFDTLSPKEVKLNIEEKKIYDSLAISFNSESIFNTLTGVRQTTHKGSDDNNATIKNDFVHANRHYVDSSGNTELESINDFIKNQDKKQKKALFKTNIEYPNIFDDEGKLISVGSTISLLNSDFYINQATKFLIISCVYNFDNFSTTIEFQPLEIFNDQQIIKFWE